MVHHQPGQQPVWEHHLLAVVGQMRAMKLLLFSHAVIMVVGERGFSPLSHLRGFSPSALLSSPFQTDFLGLGCFGLYCCFCHEIYGPMGPDPTIHPPLRPSLSFPFLAEEGPIIASTKWGIILENFGKFVGMRASFGLQQWLLLPSASTDMLSSSSPLFSSMQTQCCPSHTSASQVTKKIYLAKTS